MPTPIPRTLRAATALTVVATYALPLTVGLVSQVSHEVEHFMDELRGGGEAILEVEHDGAAPAASFVHAHGEEAAHAHEGGIALLLVAAEHAEQQQSEAAVVALELVGHVPAAGASAVVFAVDASTVQQVPGAPAADVSLRPPLPPPRA